MPVATGITRLNLRNGQAKYSAVFCSVFSAVYEAKLGHGRPLVFLQRKDDLAATIPKPINNMKPGAELTQRPESGVASAEICVMGKPHALWVFTVHLAQSMKRNLGTGGRWYSCNARMIWRQPYQNPSTT